MTKAKTCGIPRNNSYPHIYLDDEFLKKYENDTVYETTPIITPDKICLGFSREKILAEGWRNCPIICKITKVTSLNMSAEDFLSRCKTIHECLKEIKIGPLKALLVEAEAQEPVLKELGNLKLLQGIQNILSFLVQNRETLSSWTGAANQLDWKQENFSLSALFINNDIRQADAHVKINKEIKSLERLGFDSAQLCDGYGKALDFMFDKVIESIQSINKNLSVLVTHQNTIAV